MEYVLLLQLSGKRIRPLMLLTTAFAKRIPDVVLRLNIR